jgi:hypothetical protein
MLELAGRRTAGSHPYLVTAEHTAAAREILGDEALLVPEQGVILETDPEQGARIGARRTHALFAFAQLPEQLASAGLFRGGRHEGD